MGASKNDLVAAAQTLARLQGRKATLLKKVAQIDADIETVAGILQEVLQGAAVPAGE